MAIITTIENGIKALVYSSIVLLVNNFFVYRIFPMVSQIPMFVGYFLTAITGIVCVLGCVVIFKGEKQ